MGGSVNEMCLRGCGPIAFKDLRLAIVPGWVWFRRRLSVVVRTAISLQREDGGRKSDLKRLPFSVLPTFRPKVQIVSPAVVKRRRAHSFKNYGAVLLRTSVPRYVAP